MLLHECERPVQVLAGAPVVAHLGADRGQVANSPGGMVFQARGNRHPEGFVQVVATARVVRLQASRSDVGQGVRQRLPVI
jgi:hypothetical protein